MNSFKWLTALFIINPILLAQFSIPSTFVTQKSPARINAFIKESPNTYPIPNLDVPIATNNLIEKATNKELGVSSFYTKKIIQAEDESNPSFTKSLQEFDSAKNIASIVMQYPACYFADTVIKYSDAPITGTNKKILFTNDIVPVKKDAYLYKDSISIKQFSPQGLIFSTTLNSEKPFIVFQNYNKNWELKIDGKNTTILKGNYSFMYAPVPAGSHVLSFNYRPAYLLPSVIVSLVSVLLIILYLCLFTGKRKE